MGLPRRSSIKTLSSKAEGLGLIPSHGTRSHVLKLRPGTAKFFFLNSFIAMSFIYHTVHPYIVFNYSFLLFLKIWNTS